MKKINFYCLISLVLCSCQSDFSVDDIVGEWYYENGFDINSADSIYHEKTTVRFLEKGKYEYLKDNVWIPLPLTHWSVHNDLFLMGDGKAGTIVNGNVIIQDKSIWQAKILQNDTIKGWFQVYSPPLKTDLVLIKKSSFQ